MKSITARSLALLLIIFSVYCSAQTLPAPNADPNVFLPKDWVSFSDTKGDLNKDSIPDMAMIIGTPGKGAPDGSRMRSLLILFGSKNGLYSQACIAHQAVPDAFTADNMMEPFNSLKIQKNVLIVDYAWQTGARKFSLLHRYRFQNNDFYLIGATYKATELHQSYTYDYNVSNGKMILSLKNTSATDLSKTVNSEQKLNPLPLLKEYRYNTITDLLVEKGKKLLGGYISGEPDVTSTCTLDYFGMGDCAHIEFSCGDFSDAIRQLSDVDQSLWNDMTIDLEGTETINPKYYDAQFLMTYHEIQSELCGDPSGPAEVGKTYLLTGFKLAAPLVSKPPMVLEGLVGWYGFRGGKLVNQSGATGDAMGEGGQPAVDRLQHDNSAWHFNGQDHLSLIPYPKIEMPFTVAAWCKVQGDGDEMQTILSLGRSAEGTGFNFGVNIAHNNTAYFGIIGTKPIGVEKAGLAKGWHFLAATVTEKTLTLYIDGALAASTSLAAEEAGQFRKNLAETNQQPEIGRELETLDRHFKGMIDEVLIYTNALTDAQIKQVYDALGH